MPVPTPPAGPAGYDRLVTLFHDFRTAEQPPFVDGAPDYSPEAMADQIRRLPEFRRRLADIDAAGWTRSQAADRLLLEAEMNGLEFEHRSFRPWARDPSFYSVIEMHESDVPDREAPCIHGVLRMFTYRFPLDETAREEIRRKLEAIPGVLAGARRALTESTKDLHFFALRQKRGESRALRGLAQRFAESDPDLAPAANRAGAAVEDFIGWLQARYDAMPESRDGVGIEEFDWAMRHVHLVPFCWEEQRALVERELGRSWAALKMEEHRNRRLPALALPATLEELQARIDRAYPEYLDFLRNEEIFTLPDYMHLSGGRADRLPPPEELDIFSEVEQRNLLPLRCHMIHWLEKQREERNPHPLRRFPPLFNIWDSRAEGFATAFEETMLQAGIMDKEPRARELVYILLAFRAARAIGDLEMHSRRWTLRQAIECSVSGTPRGWLRPDGGTLLGDLALYLRQPGYGTSYVVGKTQFERLLADRAMQQGDAFTVKGFFDDYFSRGMIPASLLRWEMTGHEDELRKLGLVGGEKALKNPPCGATP